MQLGNITRGENSTINACLFQTCSGNRNPTSAIDYTKIHKFKYS